LLFFTMLAGAFSADAAEIEFKPNAIVDRSIVVLGDVAKISGPDAAQLGQLELFPSPSSKESRVVRASYIRQQLELHGINARQNRFTGALVVRIARNQGAAKPVEPPASIEEPLQLVFVKRAMAQGETIRTADLELRSVENVPTGVVGFSDIAAAIGQETLRVISADQPLDSRLLRKPLLVTRGQTVSVTARATGVRARTTVKALEDGARGDTILVESIDTKQKYSVIVTDHQQVETLSRAVGNSNGQPRMAVRNETRP
jgi:flagella basal body P-ring formation protein FlgA